MFKVSLEVDQKPKSVLSSCLFGQKQAQSSIVLHASNTASLDDYTSELLKVESDHLPKIQSWINKRKFRITSNSEDNSKMVLTVGDLFSYPLEKQDKSDMDKIR